MNRRSFIQTSLGLAGTMLIPFKLMPQELTYTKPIYAPANYVSALVGCAELFEFNLCVRRSDYDGLYVRQARLIKAAQNVTEQDIINEFRLKSNDDNAMLTTCAVEDNYNLHESFESSFRKHPTIGAIKNNIAKTRAHYEEKSMQGYVRSEGKNPGKYRQWVDGDVVRYHNVYDNGKETHRTIKLYSIESYARGMIASRDQEKLTTGSQYHYLTIRDMLKRQYAQFS